MRQLIYTFIFVLVSSLVVFAQSENSLCPSISVSGGGIVRQGEPLTFTVLVKDSAKNVKLEYEWTVSKGEIIEGQGTATIKVLANDLEDESVNALVRVKGLPEDCENTASESSSPICSRPELIDEFGKLSDSKVGERIKDSSRQFRKSPNSDVYIINYGTDREVAVREKQLQKSLSLICEDCRITMVNGGASPNGGVFTKIYLVPLGTDNPTP